MYQTGDTIRLKATFKSFAGNVCDLESPPTLKVYNSYKEVIDTIAGTSLTHSSTGVYYYDYTLPTTEGEYMYEFSGTVESTTILRRGYIKVGFL